MSARTLEDEQSPAKRRKLDELSDDGPLTQEDVVYFKKEAIWRQMQLYKHEVVSLKRELARYTTGIEVSESKLATLDTWYDQITVLFGDLPENSHINNNLLITIDDTELENRRQKLLTLISKGEFKDISTIDYGQLSVNNKLLTKKNHDLSEKLVKLEEDLKVFITKSLREDSATVKRFLSTSVKEESPQPEPTPKEEVKQEVVVEPVNNDELEKLTIEVEELRSNSSLLSNQLSELKEKYKVLEEKSQKLEHRLSNLEESDIINTLIYKELKSNYENVKSQNSKLSHIIESSNMKMQSYEKQLTDVTSIITKETHDEIELLKSQLSKSETDLVRIRNIRDELLSQIAIMKSESENVKTNEELYKLNQVLTSRISSLENDRNESDESLKSLSVTELIKKVIGLTEELKEIESAFKDVQEISMKKLIDTIEQQNMVRKLTVEKTKADQKYFASMRTKEAIQSENKLLKVQVQKSQEMIKNLSDLEKNYLHKIDILTNSINDYKTIKQNSVNEVGKLNQQNKGLILWKGTKQEEIKKQLEIINDKSSIITNLNDEISNNKITINKLQMNLESTESLLQKYKSGNTNSIIAEDEQQLEALRSIAKCSVCTKNWKDTAITVCGHVFCNSCTQERLAARLRRCPSCNKGFSHNDLLSIHL